MTERERERYAKNVSRSRVLAVNLIGGADALILRDCDPSVDDTCEPDEIRIELGCQKVHVKYLDVPCIIAALEEALGWQVDS